MTVTDLIRLKRDGGELSGDQLRAFTRDVAGDRVGEAQLGAFLMAVYLRGMSDREQADLTLAMRDSGDVMRWDDLDGPVLDKHSTGGVGDLVSLVLAPLMAACGAFVPMISGRGLGHTGGTLDKLESIPGFDVTPSRTTFRETVREAGFAMVGQDAGLAPADRRMYAARDVTATVSCRPLIVSSILSKKLAEGLDGLVMDIKTGDGAVMPNREAARSLGQAICDVAAEAGLACTALLTDMDQPLARSAGNALEVREALAFLRGEPASPRLAEVVFALCRELLATGAIEADPGRAQALLERALDSGEAAERFSRMVSLQGGPSDLLDHPDRHLDRAPVVRPVQSVAPGVVAAIRTREIGHVVHSLGGGRTRVEDRIDHAVGLSALVAVGEPVETGDPLAEVHAANDDDARAAVKRVLEAVTIAETAQAGHSAVHERLVPGRAADARAGKETR